jgi:hypothetical protein
VTRTFPKTQLTLFHCLLAAICFNMIDCTIVYCQAIQPGAEIDNRSAQSESSIAVVSTSDIRSLPDNRRQPMNGIGNYHSVGESTFVFCQTIQRVAKSDNHSSQSESSIVLVSTSDSRSPPDNRRQPINGTTKTNSFGKIFPNPFSRYLSDKTCETGTVIKESKKQLINARKTKSSRTASMEAAKQAAESEQTMDLAFAQPISILPANPTLDSNVTWEFELQAVIPAKLTQVSRVTWDSELQSESDDRPHSSTGLTTQPTRQMQAATPNNTKLIYRPAVPTVDKQGRILLKPIVTLSSGEIISDTSHSKRIHKRSVSHSVGPVAIIVNRLKRSLGW